MHRPVSDQEEPLSADGRAIYALYQAWITGWNYRDAEAMAATCAEDGEVIGYDGSHMSGRAAIAAELRQIFTDHQTPTYIVVVKQIRMVGPDVAILRAIAGLIHAGQSDLDPRLNAVQTLVTVKQAGEWHIALLQNTPAQLHGRPEAVAQMTEELRQQSAHPS